MLRRMRAQKDGSPQFSRTRPTTAFLRRQDRAQSSSLLFRHPTTQRVQRCSAQWSVSNTLFDATHRENPTGRWQPLYRRSCASGRASGSTGSPRAGATVSKLWCLQTVGHHRLGRSALVQTHPNASDSVPNNERPNFQPARAQALSAGRRGTSRRSDVPDLWALARRPGIFCASPPPYWA